jgi:hypothetical protein
MPDISLRCLAGHGEKKRSIIFLGLRAAARVNIIPIQKVKSLCGPKPQKGFGRKRTVGVSVAMIWPWDGNKVHERLGLFTTALYPGLAVSSHQAISSQSYSVYPWSGEHRPPVVIDSGNGTTTPGLLPSR